MTGTLSRGRVTEEIIYMGGCKFYLDKHEQYLYIYVDISVWKMMICRYIYTNVHYLF